MRNLLVTTTALTLLAIPAMVGAQQPTGGNQSNQQNQAQPNPSKPGNGADITVQQKPAQITVQQQPPQVNIQQPKPEVTVNQQKPDVTVQQAKPEVTVNQGGKPDVTVVPGGTGRSDAARNNQMATAPDTMPMAQAEQLIGKNVVSSGGQNMGEIENLIIDGKGQIKAAVVQWGGFLGIGDKERVIRWNQIRYDHADNRAVIDMTKEQIQALPEYDGPRSVADLGADAKPLR